MQLNRIFLLVAIILQKLFLIVSHQISHSSVCWKAIVTPSLMSMSPQPHFEKHCQAISGHLKACDAQTPTDWRLQQKHTTETHSLRPVLAQHLFNTTIHFPHQDKYLKFTVAIETHLPFQHTFWNMIVAHNKSSED